MRHLSHDQIVALSDEGLSALVASTKPDGIFADEVRWAQAEIERRNRRAFTVEHKGRDARGERFHVVIDGKPVILTDSAERANAWGRYLTLPEGPEKTRARLDTVPAFFWRDDRDATRQWLLERIDAGDLAAVNDDLECIEEKIADWASD